MISSSRDSINKSTPLVYKRPVSSSPTAIFAKTKEEQFKKASTEKNPLVLPTFEEQGAAVQSKLVRLYQDKGYQNLKPGERVAVRARIYNDYVVPSFKAKGLQPPDMKVWLKSSKSADFNVDPKTFFESKSIAAAHDLAVGAGAAGLKIGLFGIKVENKALMSMYGLADMFASHEPFIRADDQKTAHDFIDLNKQVAQKLVKMQKSVVEQQYNKAESFLQTHPREGFLASAPRWVGEQIVQLPLYEAASAALGSLTAGRVILGTAQGPATQGIQNLSKTLATSQVGQFVGKRLSTAASIYLGSVMSGDSNKEATANAGGATVIDGVFSKVASAPLIKKWTANLLAMGGKPFATSVTESAINEATFMTERTASRDTEAISNTAFHGRVVEHRQPKVDGFRPGFFSVNGEKYEYKTSDERLKTYDAIENRLKAHRKETDPVLNSVMDAELHTVESVALRNFGKSIKQMTPEEINAVLKRRLELQAEATYELPAHVGDLNKHVVSQENAKDLVDNPIAGSFAAEMKAAGFPDMDEIMNESQIQDIEVQTGIKSAKGTARKIASVRTPKISKVKGEITSGSASLSPEDFDAHRKSSIAYFRNNGVRRASDGTVIGGRDKRPWNVRVAAENTKQFVETLKEADGNKINFENDYHRMLFHWANRDQLPKPIKEKLLREMKKIVETGPRPRYNMGIKDFNTEADWSMVHLLKLAQSGRLATEGNVFFSSKLGGPENWTPWQSELQTEIDKKEVDTLKKLLVRHPEAKRGLVSSMKKIQAMRFESDKPEDWMLYNNAVSKYVDTAINSLKGEK